MDLVTLFEQFKMALAFACFLFCIFVLIAAIRNGEFSEDFVPYWEKEERKAAKKAAKEKAREERRQEKYWRNVEKQYR